MLNNEDVIDIKIVLTNILQEENWTQMDSKFKLKKLILSLENLLLDNGFCPYCGSELISEKDKHTGAFLLHCEYCNYKE